MQRQIEVDLEVAEKLELTITYSGNNNTDGSGIPIIPAAIVTILGAGTYAAKLEDDLIYGGFRDWFLTSKNTLHYVYEQRSTIGGYILCN